jgi:hypothetical protein
MTYVKALSAVIILSAAVATPVFAQPTHHGRTHGLRDFRGVYNQSTEPLYATPRTLDRSDGFGFSGTDRSFPGGEDPSLHPAGN